MNKILATLGLAALLVPAAALADDNAAVPTSAQMQARMAEFRQIHDKMRQLHLQARAQILNSLTPSHKAAVGNLIGQLAVSSNPNPDATARQINALLSAGEAQSVVRVHDSLRSQMRSLMASVHAGMQSPAGAPGHPFKSGEEPPHPNDAGHILLMLLSGPHGMMMHHGM